MGRGSDLCTPWEMILMHRSPVQVTAAAAAAADSTGASTAAAAATAAGNGASAAASVRSILSPQGIISGAADALEMQSS